MLSTKFRRKQIMSSSGGFREQKIKEIKRIVERRGERMNVRKETKKGKNT